MRDALADHDAIVRRTTADRGGIVFKTVGDSFCCAFAHAEDAAGAAVDAQRALASHAWPDEVGEIRVRIGIHTGNAVERDGDYFGPTVNRVARLMSIGNGGQILVSSSTAALLRGTLRKGLALRDLGAHRLRDLSQAETTFQLDAEGLRVDFPALASLDTRPNNLPSQISSFIGRERELDELQTFLTEHRLVTITGPGGMGKTRLALQVAASAIGRFQDGAWLVELSSIGDPLLVFQTIASALGVREIRLESIEETLLRELSRKQLLLIVDNAEHLLADVAVAVKAILTRCRDVRILVTSRERLHLTGEQTYRLLAMPEAPPEARAADLTEHDSTRLFLERARAIAPDFVVPDRDAGEVASLCLKLEGIPLAIELAAARVTSLSVRQLNERLSERLVLLASKDNTLGRHRTLRATIDWSYRLLNEDEKRVFPALSVFANGFTLEACERVAPAKDAATLDVLQSLAEKSFVQADLRSEGARFRPLDVMREYGWTELEAAGLAAETQRRHATYYAEFAARGERVSAGDASAWYKQLDDETHNLRLALEWCVRNDAVKGVGLGLDLAGYWRVRSNITEARVRFAQLLTLRGIEPQRRAALLCCAAGFAAMQDDFAQSLSLAEEALSLYREAADSEGTAEALFRIAEVEHRKGRLARAKELYEDACDLFVTVGKRRGEMLCIANLGMLARQQGDYQNAKALLEDALARARASGERRIVGDFIIALGWIDLYLEDLDASKQLFEQALAEKETERDRYGACSARHGLATVALKDGRLDEAFEQFKTTVHAAIDLQLHDYLFRGFDGISAVLALKGEVEPAARYLGLAERLFRESGRELRDSIAYDSALHSIESALSSSRFSELLAEGACMPVDAAGATVTG